MDKILSLGQSGGFFSFNVFQEEDRDQGEESREGDSFKAFIKSRTDITEEKIKNLHIEEN